MALDSERIEKLAEVLRVSPAAIRSAVPNWADMAVKDGVIVNLTIRRWRGMSKAGPERLGIVFENGVDRSRFKEAFTAAMARLVPKDVLDKWNKLETAGRDLLEYYTFKFQIGNTHVLYFRGINGNFLKWQEENEKRRQEYLASAQEYADSWDENVARVLQDREGVARDSWNRMSVSAKQSWVKNQVRYRQEASEEAFISAYVESFRAAMPTKEKFLASFAWDATFQALDFQATGSLEELQGLSESQAAMRKAVWDSRKGEYESQVIGFMESLIGETRQLAYDAVTRALKGLEKGGEGRLAPKTYVGLRNMVDKVSGLVAPDDKEMQRVLANVKAISRADGKSAAFVRKGGKDFAQEVVALPGITEKMRNNILALPECEDNLETAEDALPEVIKILREAAPDLIAEATRLSKPTVTNVQDTLERMVIVLRKELVDLGREDEIVALDATNKVNLREDLVDVDDERVEKARAALRIPKRQTVEVEI